MKVLSTLRSRGRLVALALLPAMLLRVLTPVGFMPMHDAHGDLYLAFCPGAGDTTLPPMPDDPHRNDHAMHHHAMHDEAGAPGDDPAPRHHDLCPYALSAGPVLAHSIAGIAAALPRAVPAPRADYPLLSLPTIERAQSARAPPAPRTA